VSQWPSTKAAKIFAHFCESVRDQITKRLTRCFDAPREGDYVWAFHDAVEIGPRMLAELRSIPDCVRGFVVPAAAVSSVADKPAGAKRIQMRRVMLGKSNQTLMPQKWEPSVQMGVVMPRGCGTGADVAGEFGVDFSTKMDMRTCFNAQEEIYQSSMDELAQLREVHPELTRYIGPRATSAPASPLPSALRLPLLRHQRSG